LPGVIGPIGNTGLPLNETTLAEQLKKAGYATAAVGKWHLGQRVVYLPGNRGFDYYLGIPYSDDMGNGIATPCAPDKFSKEETSTQSSSKLIPANGWSKHEYRSMKLLGEDDDDLASKNHADEEEDSAGHYLPLVYQAFNKTRILEQPLDFTHLAQKYNAFATDFIETHKDEPFFLYVPFSHVHCTAAAQPEKQYAGCDWKNATARGSFGDALAEADWIVGNIMETLRKLKLEENTLVLFTSDNGPWLSKGLSAGSEGLFTGRYAGYYDTGKASTWEGGIRMPAFAYWKGTIQPFSRSSEIVSSLDIFPTLSSLAGIPLPDKRAYDGRDMTQVLQGGKSKHDFLFFYGTCNPVPYYSVTAVRHGKYKAHWCTAPGLSGDVNGTMTKIYDKYPLLFDVNRDPSEAEPISTGEMPNHPEHRAAMERIMKAYAMEVSTFTFGKMVPYPDGPGEGPGLYGVCCDRSKNCNCDDLSDRDMGGILNIGTKRHHDKYHEIRGEEEPSPSRTRAQRMLQNIVD
jgi:arylsulfatase A